MKKILSIFFLMTTILLGRDFSLEEAVELSTKNSKSIKISEKDLEISEINLRKAFKLALPKIIYKGQYAQTNYDRMISISNKLGMEKGRSGYTQSITISQPLFMGGSIFAGIKGAKSYENIVKYTFLSSKISERIETIKLFFDILNAEKNLEILKNSQNILRKRYDKQKIQQELRLIKKTDLSQTEYSLLEIESNIIALKSTIDTLKQKLRIKMDISNEENINLLNFEIPLELSRNIDLDKDMKQAVNESLLAKIVEEQHKVSQAKAMAMAGNILPKVNAFARYGSTEKTKISNTYEDANWVGGIEVTWNIFSFGSDYDDYKISKLEKEKEKLKVMKTKENIEISVKGAYFDLIRLEKLIYSRKKALEVAKLNFEMDQERYEADLISTIDYLSTENTYRQARIDYNKTLTDYYVAFEKYRSLLI